MRNVNSIVYFLLCVMEILVAFVIYMILVFLILIILKK